MEGAEGRASRTTGKTSNGLASHGKECPGEKCIFRLSRSKEVVGTSYLYPDLRPKNSFAEAGTTVCIPYSMVWDVIHT